MSVNIHASCVCIKNKGILFLGDSGSGKSDISLRLIADYKATLIGDDRIDILIQVINKLDIEGLRAAYAYSNEVLGLDENIDELVYETEKWMRECGGTC